MRELAEWLLYPARRVGRWQGLGGSQSKADAPPAQNPSLSAVSKEENSMRELAEWLLYPARRVGRWQGLGGSQSKADAPPAQNPSLSAYML